MQWKPTEKDSEERKGVRECEVVRSLRMATGRNESEKLLAFIKLEIQFICLRLEIVKKIMNNGTHHKKEHIRSIIWTRRTRTS